MSALTFENIPSAMELKEKINTLKQQKIEEQQRIEEREKKYKMYANQYKKIVKKAVCDGINNMLLEHTFSTIIELPMDSFFCEDSVTFSEIHYNMIFSIYGYFSYLSGNLFEDIQIELFKKGYYLLQNHDDYDYYFTLSIGKPDGYDEEPVKCERFNKIPEH